MSDYYTKQQTDAQASVIGSRIKAATTPASIISAIISEPDVNLLTDQERTKLAGLEGSKFLGQFATISDIPTAAAGPGSYADVDPGDGTDTRRAIWDSDAGEFVFSASTPAGETAASVKEKYESNANTNPFTDTDKAKLDSLQPAADISTYTAMLDAALQQ